MWKAKASLRKVSQEIVKERLQALRKQQMDEALAIQRKVYALLEPTNSATSVPYRADIDPEPLLKLRSEDKTLMQVDVKDFQNDLVSELFNQSLHVHEMLIFSRLRSVAR